MATRSSTLGEDMALAAGGTLLFMAANTLAPGVGGVGAVATLAGLAHAREKVKEARAAHVTRVNELVAEDRVTREATRPSAKLTPAEAWERWLPWAELVAGAKVPVPDHLAHPASVGFRPTRLASKVGQVADWARPAGNGSRLHAHEYADGRVVVHHDCLDPALGPGAATVHWLHECPEGNLLLGALLVAQFGALAWVLVQVKEGAAAQPAPAQAVATA